MLDEGEREEDISNGKSKNVDVFSSIFRLRFMFIVQLCNHRHRHLLQYRRLEKNGCRAMQFQTSSLVENCLTERRSILRGTSLDVLGTAEKNDN